MKTLTDALLRAWYRDPADASRWLLLPLWPLAQLLQGVARRRRRLLQARAASLPVPVIVVGNISVGGTGKTPLLCALAQAMTERGLRVGIVSRGYGGSHTGVPRTVQPDDTADLVGDEPLLLAQLTGCPVVIGRDRLAAVQALLAVQPVDIVLSDDGLQHYALPRTVEIAVIDGARGLGNGWCLPAGPLREPPLRLAEVDLVVVNGATANIYRTDQTVVQLDASHWVQVSDGALLPLSAVPPGSRVHAVAGIGHPARFFESLRALGLDVIEHPFPDHHRYTASELAFGDGLPVVMTEKDAVKCAVIAPAGSVALRVGMALPTDWVDALLATVAKKTGRA